MSSKLTDITNQANVANRIADAFGIEAGRRVWASSPEDWERVASEYVSLTSGDHYGTEWVKDERIRPLHSVPDIRASMARHPAGKAITPDPIAATEHASLVGPQTQAPAGAKGRTAMASLLRFLGAR